MSCFLNSPAPCPSRPQARSLHAPSLRLILGRACGCHLRMWWPICLVAPQGAELQWEATLPCPFWNVFGRALSGEGCWGRRLCCLLPGRAHIASFAPVTVRCLWSEQLTLSHSSDQGHHPSGRPAHLVGSSRGRLRLPPHEDVAGPVRLFSV